MLQGCLKMEALPEKRTKIQSKDISLSLKEIVQENSVKLTTDSDVEKRSLAVNTATNKNQSRFSSLLTQSKKI